MAANFADFLQESEVPVAGTSFKVRGISLEDASKIMQVHGAALNALYLERIVNAETAPEELNVAALGRAVLDTVPEAAAAVIALAADAEDQYGYIRRLPVTVQVDAIEKILKLTFYTEEDLGNFIGTVLRGSESVQRILKNVMTSDGPSTLGSEGSEKA